MQQQERKIVLSRYQWLWLLLVEATALFLGLGALFLMGRFARILAITFIAVSIAAALSPVVDWLARRLPRSVAAILVYAVLLLLLVGVLALIIPPLVNQVQNFIDRIPDIFNRVEQWVEQQSGISRASLFDAAVSQIQSSGTQLLSLPVDVFSALLDVILVIALSLYMLLEVDSIRSFGLSLFPRPQRQDVWDVSTQMLNAAGGFVRGIIINVLVIGVLMYLGLSIIGVEFALVLGILAGVLEIIPIVGTVVSSITIIVVALLQAPATALITAIFVLVVQQFEGNILTPNVMRSQAKVSPVLVLIAVFAGGAVGGVVGTLVSIPLVAALRVFVVRVIAPAIRSLGSNTDAQNPEV